MAAADSIMRRHFSHALASRFSPRWAADSAGVAGVKSTCITQGPHAQGHQARLRVVQAFRLPHGRQRHVRRSQSKSTQGFGERSISPLVREWVLTISRTHACTPAKKSGEKNMMGTFDGTHARHAAWDSHAVVQLPMQCPTPPKLPYPAPQLPTPHRTTHQLSQTLTLSP